MLINSGENLNSQTGAITMDGSNWDLSGVERHNDLQGAIGYQETVSNSGSVEHTASLRLRLHVGVGGTMTIGTNAYGVTVLWNETWGDQVYKERGVVLTAHRGPA